MRRPANRTMRAGIRLKLGKARLGTPFTDKKAGKSRGAYFAYVRRVSG